MHKGVIYSLQLTIYLPNLFSVRRKQTLASANTKIDATTE